MIACGDRYDEGAGRKVFRRYYSLFPEVTKILPCWAVTSLSARGRLPFEPGFFDLVVIDEASQCDIASALPLLFRAKSEEHTSELQSPCNLVCRLLLEKK